MAKVERVSLTEESIQSLIDKLNAYSSSLDGRNKALLAKVAKDGESYAKTMYGTSTYFFETGETRASIDGSVSGKTARVSADGHAAPVEFGFGVVGSQNPHPSGTGHYTTEGAPWKFKYQGRVYHTFGRESRPFLWPTAAYWRNTVRVRYKERFKWQ